MCGLRKTGMIVEPGICACSDAIIEGYTSPSFYLKMTQHITARLTHAMTTGAVEDQNVIINFKADVSLNEAFTCQHCHCPLCPQSVGFPHGNNTLLLFILCWQTVLEQSSRYQGICSPPLVEMSLGMTLNRP